MQESVNKKRRKPKRSVSAIYKSRNEIDKKYYIKYSLHIPIILTDFTNVKPGQIRSRVTGYSGEINIFEMKRVDVLFLNMAGDLFSDGCIWDFPLNILNLILCEGNYEKVIDSNNNLLCLRMHQIHLGFLIKPIKKIWSSTQKIYQVKNFEVNFLRERKILCWPFEMISYINHTYKIISETRITTSCLLEYCQNSLE